MLRALDTVEDDMTIPRGEKEGMLRQFHSNLYSSTWRYLESNEKDKTVLEEFPIVSTAMVPTDNTYIIILSMRRALSKHVAIYSNELHRVIYDKL